MGVLYKCKGCGLGIDVVAGAAKFPGMTIHCPTCGGKAKYHPAGLGDHKGEIVKVELGDDGKVTQPLASLKEPSVVAMQPTVRVSAVDTNDLKAADTPDKTPGKGRPAVGSGPSVPKRVFQPEVRKRRPDMPSVTRIRSINIPPEDVPKTPAKTQTKTTHTSPTKTAKRPKEDTPQPPQRLAAPQELIDTDKGFPVQADDHEAPEQAKAKPAPESGAPDRDQDGVVDGKAWSASVIRRALRASGIDDSGPTEAEHDHTGMMFGPSDSPQVQVELPGAGNPLYVEDERTLNIVPQEPPPPADPTPPPRAKPRDVTRVGQHDSGMVDSVLFQERSRRRALWIVLFFALVIGGSVVGGYFMNQESSPGRAPEDPEVVALAEDRAERLGLDPIDFEIPFEIEGEPEVLDYPTRLFLRVTVTNRSEQPMSALRLTGSWNLVHDSHSQVFATEASYEPSPTPDSPLQPGDSIAVLLEMETEIVPQGDSRESFVWISVAAIAADQSSIEGAAGMIEIGR